MPTVQHCLCLSPSWKKNVRRPLQNMVAKRGPQCQHRQIQWGQRADTGGRIGLGMALSGAKTGSALPSTAEST